MRAVDVIRRKRDGEELTAPEIEFFVDGARRSALAEEGDSTSRTWSEYQLSAFLMAVYLRGMSTAETAVLTRAMTDSGERLDLSDIPGPKVDKHSTGGVGDKTSLILGPLAVACGAIVPMMSGRGLGHTGGTLDKLESIANFRVHLTEAEFRRALREVGLGMIGQTRAVAPADKKLYSLRDVTATVESIPLITGSILSKKIAEGIRGLVLDVKCGHGAFMKSRSEAKALATSLVNVAKSNGLDAIALLTPMDVPLGRTIGNSLEVIESIETLKGQGPKDLTDLSVLLAARMVKLAGLATDNADAQKQVRAALASGAGLEVFRKCVAQQGGDPRVIDDYSRLPVAGKTMTLRAKRSGILAEMHAGAVGIVAMVLGAGREKAEDAVDHSVGVVCAAKPGEKVAEGEAVYEVYYRDDWKLKAALPLLESSFTIADTAPAEVPLVYEEIG